MEIHRLCCTSGVKILTQEDDLAASSAKEKHIFLTIFSPARFYASLSPDLRGSAIGIGQGVDTDVREPEVLDRASEPVNVLLDRLASFQAMGVSECRRKWEFPKDVISDQRLPFAGVKKSFDVALQKIGGDCHARFPLCWLSLRSHIAARIDKAEGKPKKRGPYRQSDRQR